MMYISKNKALALLLGNNNPRTEDMDFSHMDLTGVDFRGKDFKNCKFNGAILDYADFRGCSFYMVDFTQASMKFTKMDGAQFWEIGISPKDYYTVQGAAPIPWFNPVFAKVCKNTRITMLAAGVASEDQFLHGVDYKSYTFLPPRLSL